jgi:hypothetical protein
MTSTAAVLVRPARRDELDVVGRPTVDAYVEDYSLPRDHFYATELADAAGRGEHGEVLVALRRTARWSGRSRSRGRTPRSAVTSGPVS